MLAENLPGFVFQPVDMCLYRPSTSHYTIQLLPSNITNLPLHEKNLVSGGGDWNFAFTMLCPGLEGEKKGKTNKQETTKPKQSPHPPQAKTLTKPNLQWFLGILINKPWQIVFKVLSTIRSENKNQIFVKYQTDTNTLRKEVTDLT